MTKNFFCPRCKNSRTVGEHPYDHTWLVCNKCNYGFPYEQAICPEFDEASPQKILTWAGADVTYGEGGILIGGGKSKPKKYQPYWQMSWPVGFIQLSWSSETDEVYAQLEAAMFIYLFCTGVPADLAVQISSHYSRGREEWGSEAEATME